MFLSSQVPAQMPQHRPATSGHSLAGTQCDHKVSTTSSLLLTNHRVRDLTLQFLASRFSGILQIISHEATPQSEATGPWYKLATDSIFISRHKWLFNRVKELQLQLRTINYRETWSELPNIMPNLKLIRLRSPLGPWYRPIFGIDNSSNASPDQEEGQSRPTESIDPGLGVMQELSIGTYDDAITRLADDESKAWIVLFEEKSHLFRTDPKLDVTIRVAAAGDFSWTRWVSGMIYVLPPFTNCYCVSSYDVVAACVLVGMALRLVLIP